jgi:hypothetical protein
MPDPGRDAAKNMAVPGRLTITGYCQSQTNEIMALLKKHYPQLEIRPMGEQLADDLKSKKDAESKAQYTIAALHKQQQALYDEFVLLRQRYDEMKTSLLHVLWVSAAKYHPDLREIPAMEKKPFIETSMEIGDNISIGELLGEGQFATVKSCRYKNNPTSDDDATEDINKDFALKIIKKEKITSFIALSRGELVS